MSERPVDVTGMDAKKKKEGDLNQISFRVAPSLYRAYHRCVWIQRMENGRTTEGLAAEMVEDFLKKHGC